MGVLDTRDREWWTLSFCMGLLTMQRPLKPREDRKVPKAKATQQA